MKLNLFYPVKPYKVTQEFGVNGAYYQKNGINIKGHNGIDLWASHGQSVYAVHDGICYPEVDDKGGNGVVIRTLQPFDYNGTQCYFKSIFWHLIKSDAVVKTGQQVKAGDLIGYADNTGLSTGDHLHFGLKPQQWNENNWTWVNVNDANGYLGAIDPTPYFNGLYAEDIPVIQKAVEIAPKIAQIEPEVEKSDADTKNAFQSLLGAFLKLLGHFRR